MHRRKLLGKKHSSENKENNLDSKLSSSESRFYLIPEPGPLVLTRTHVFLQKTQHLDHAEQLNSSKKTGIKII
jgi:hypothetical protein